MREIITQLQPGREAGRQGSGEREGRKDGAGEKGGAGGRGEQKRLEVWGHDQKTG